MGKGFMGVLHFDRAKTEQNERGDEESDERLVALLSGGDFMAYGRLIRKHQVLVNGLAFGLTKDRQKADQLAVVVLMTLWTERNEMKNPIPLSGYLLAMMIRLYKRGFPYLSDI
jgi:DNA-directed RNA polymerase specialized sigma24 family protein